MQKRIGFVGIVIEEPASIPAVNQGISQYADMVTGRIGIPDHRRAISVIGLIVEGTNDRIGALTGKLGNLPGVRVKSALTTKSYEDDTAGER